MLGVSDSGYGLRKEKSGVCHAMVLTPKKIFGLQSMHCETPVLTRFGQHVITWTLATGSQGFDPKRGIL